MCSQTKVDQRLASTAIYTGQTDPQSTSINQKPASLARKWSVSLPQLSTNLAFYIAVNHLNATNGESDQGLTHPREEEETVERAVVISPCGNAVKMITISELLHMPLPHIGGHRSYR